LAALLACAAGCDSAVNKLTFMKLVLPRYYCSYNVCGLVLQLYRTSNALRLALAITALLTIIASLDEMHVDSADDFDVTIILF